MVVLTSRPELANPIPAIVHTCCLILNEKKKWTYRPLDKARKIKGPLILMKIQKRKKKKYTEQLQWCNALVLKFQHHNLIWFLKPTRLFSPISINCHFPLKEGTRVHVCTTVKEPHRKFGCKGQRWIPKYPFRTGKIKDFASNMGGLVTSGVNTANSEGSSCSRRWWVEEFTYRSQGKAHRA